MKPQQFTAHSAQTLNFRDVARSALKHQTEALLCRLWGLGEADAQKTVFQSAMVFC